MGRVLAVDPGEKRIGLALSDPSGTLATPHSVLRHSSRAQDAAAIVQLARDQDVSCILVGLALDRQGQEGPQARRALRLVAQLRLLTELPVETRTKAARPRRRPPWAAPPALWTRGPPPSCSRSTSMPTGRRGCAPSGLLLLAGALFCLATGLLLGALVLLPAAAAELGPAAPGLGAPQRTRAAGLPHPAGRGIGQASRQRPNMRTSWTWPRERWRPRSSIAWRRPAW